MINMKKQIKQFIEDFPVFAILLCILTIACAFPVASYTRKEAKYIEAINLVNNEKYGQAIELLNSKPLRDKGRVYYKDTKKILDYAQAKQICGTTEAASYNVEYQLKNYEDAYYLVKPYYKDSYWAFGAEAKALSIDLQDKVEKCKELAEANDSNKKKTINTSKGKSCLAIGCSKNPTKDSWYCENHTCHENGCNLKVRSEGALYCEQHKGDARDIIYQKIKSKYTQSSPDSKKTTTTKKHSSSKKKEMPDCDDYEDFDEFMDDWDGEMPDGSDAMDYWDNW